MLIALNITWMFWCLYHVPKYSKVGKIYLYGGISFSFKLENIENIILYNIHQYILWIQSFF